MKRWFRPLSTLTYCALLLPMGCDSGGDEKQPEEKAPAPEPKAPEPTKQDDGSKAKLDAQAAEIAALKAEAAAAKEALAAANAENKELQAELDAPPEPEDEIGEEKALADGQSGPVSLAAFTFEHQEASYGHAKGRHQIKAFVDVTRNEDKQGGLYAKAACLVGAEVMVDVLTVSNEHGDLGKLGVKETKKFDKVFFQRDGLAEKPSRCQFTYDFGASGFSVKLAQACWDGKAITAGECAEKLAPRVDGDAKLVPFDFSVHVSDAFLSKDKQHKSLYVRFSGRFNQPFDHAPHLYLKTACKAGEKTYIEVNPDFPHVKPFHLDHGEVMPFGHAQFMLNPLPTEPERCDLTVLYVEKFGEPEQELSTACWKKGGDVTDGYCNGKPDHPAPAPVTADSIELSDVSFHWNEHYKDKSKSQLIVNLAATVKKTMEASNRVHVKTQCDDKTDKDHILGPDLGQIDPDESILLTVTAFAMNPIAPDAKQCELTVSAAKKFNGDDAVEVGKICIKGKEAKVGACAGEGK